MNPRTGAGISPERLVLSNGLVVILQENRLTPSVCAGLRLRTGSRREEIGKIGLANFTARLLDAGTASRRKDEIAETIDSTGASFGISSDNHVTDLHASLLGEDLGTILPLLSEIVREPTFPEPEMEKMRDRLLVAIREDRDDTRSEAERGLREAIYPEGHSYRYPGLGYEDDVRSMSREDLVSFHGRTFTPEGGSLVLVGDFDSAAALRVIRETLGAWEAGGKPAADGVDEVPWRTSPVETIIPMTNKSQADIAFGCRGIARSHPDYHAVAVMNMILGRFGMGGRLGQNIREEQGLAYYAFSVFWASIGAGPFAVRVGANPERVPRAVAAIRQELERIRSDLVTEKELEEVQDYLVGSLPRAIETNQGIASHIQTMELFDLGLDYLDRYPGIIRGVSREEVLQAARKHIDTDGFVVSIAGPFDGSVLE